MILVTTGNAAPHQYRGQDEYCKKEQEQVRTAPEARVRDLSVNVQQHIDNHNSNEPDARLQKAEQRNGVLGLACQASAQQASRPDAEDENGDDARIQIDRFSKIEG